MSRNPNTSERGVLFRLLRRGIGVLALVLAACSDSGDVAGSPRYGARSIEELWRILDLESELGNATQDDAAGIDDGQQQSKSQ